MDPGRLDSCWTDTASWQLERERDQSDSKNTSQNTLINGQDE